MSSIVFLIVSLSTLPYPSLAAQWDYKKGEAGPSHWHTHYNTCGGARQSPVNIVPTKDVEHSYLRLTNYDKQPGQAHLINNGHTAKLTTQAVTAEDTPIMEGGGLPNRYKFSQVHFHWGSEDGQGSEHQVNGKTFPLEAHFVHFKAIHPNISAALEESAGDSLAVLGILFQVSNTSNPGLEKLLPKLPQVKKSGDKILDAPLFPLSYLWDSVDFSSFYRYEGSLTTPGCNEIVQWTVIKKPVRVTKEQLEVFRSLEDKEKKPLVDNFRPAQNIGKRDILSVTTGSGGSGTWGKSGLLMCIFSCLLLRL